MILSKPDIKRRLSLGAQGDATGVVISPPPIEERIGAVSVDLLLGRRFTRFKDKESFAHIAAILVRESLFKSEELWEHEQDQDYVDIEPGGFVLAQTLETVTMPSDLMGLVEGRSSLARVGLSVHLTAPKIDPGFEGTIALEIANAGPATVRLEAQKDRPAQLILLSLSEGLDPEDVYGAGDSGMFQYQTEPIPR